MALLAWLTVATVATAREAPNLSAVPVNQLVVSGNACGPAALLNAFRFGNACWQRAGSAVVGASDKERVTTMIREIGMRPSKNLPGHPRWSRRGVSVSDLRDMANEMTAGLSLPPMREDVIFLNPRESPEELVRRAYQRIDSSLARGLPPIVSLRRYAWRQLPGTAPQWVVIDAHFVTLTAIADRLEKNARTFAVDYIDPWGAKRCQGSIGIPQRPIFPMPTGGSSCLAAEFPQSPVGKSLVHRGELTVLVPAAIIGRW